MTEINRETELRRERAAREIALAEATGAKAHASPDYKTVFIERRDGTRETVRVPDAKPH
jgi:hypothetical protein